MLERDLVLPHLIERRAREDGDRVFLQHVDGPTMTYAQLHEESLRWAGTLQRLGVNEGDRVLVMLPPSFNAITVWLGIAWLKAIEVPVHTGYRARMLEYTLENADASAVVLAPEFEERFEGLGEGLPFVQMATGEPAHDLEGPAPYDISSILYTSGTTGPSKGVMVPWAQAHATATGCIP